MPEPTVNPGGEPAIPDNPYAPFGLDGDGNPLAAPATPKDPAAAASEMQRVLSDAAAGLQKVASLEKKFEVIDRLLKAVTGEGATPGSPNQAVWEDLKKIAPPKVREVFDLLERDPDALNRLTGSVRALHVDRLVGLNERAHAKVLELATKAGMKADSTDAMATMIYPFERAITEVINSQPELQQRFLSGQLQVVDEVFHQLYAPHLSQRLKDKKKLGAPGDFPKAPPRASVPGSGTPEEKKPDITTPRGKAAFHKDAVSRWFSKLEAGKDE